MGSNNFAMRALTALFALIFALLGCSLWSLQWRYVVATFGVLFGFIIISAYKAGHRHALADKTGTAASQASESSMEVKNT